METFLAVLTLGMCNTPAAADPLLRDFAICTGRFSALVEHQWMMDGPASEQSARVRDALWSLVEAVAGPEDTRAAMGWRIEAKAGHRALLARAWLNDDQSAEARSAQLLQACADLVGQS